MSAVAGDFDSISVHECIERDSLELLKACANSDNITIPNAAGMLPLTMAAAVGKLEMVAHLHTLGANPNLIDASGMHAGWWAAYYREWEVLKFLLNNGLSDVDKKPSAETAEAGGMEDYEGVTILWMAGSEGRWDIVEDLILKHGAKDVNAESFERDEPDNTPIGMAISANKIQAVRLLAQRGARVNLNHDINPLTLARKNPAIFRFLVTEGRAEIDRPIPPNLVGSEVGAVTAIRANACTLFEGIQRDNLTPAVIEIILSSGAHLNQRSRQNNNTPLHLAVELRKLKAIASLLSVIKHKKEDEQLALLTAANRNNHTPIDLAATQDKKEKLEIQKHLLIYFGQRHIVKIITDSLNQNNLLTGLMNVLQPIINRSTFKFYQKLILTQMAGLPNDIKLAIRSIENTPIFAGTELGKKAIEKAHRKAHASKAIRKALYDVKEKFKGMSSKKPMMKSRKKDKENQKVDEKTTEPLLFNRVLTHNAHLINRQPTALSSNAHAALHANRIDITGKPARTNGLVG